MYIKNYLIALFENWSSFMKFFYNKNMFVQSMTFDVNILIGKLMISQHKGFSGAGLFNK